MRRSIGAALAAVSLLAGCAALNTVDSDVTSYSQWPAERKPGSFAFERLPSQQAHVDRQAKLEDAARGALAAAGFSEASDAAGADVTVQLGARVTRYASPWPEPYPWRAGPYGWGGWGGRGWGPRFGLGLHYSAPQVDSEVAVLIRDRKSGATLYETRAASDGYGGEETLAAMFEAALKDFPQPAVNPRRISVPLSR
jgi:hypothetical protein